MPTGKVSTASSAAGAAALACSTASATSPAASSAASSSASGSSATCWCFLACFLLFLLSSASVAFFFLPLDAFSDTGSWSSSAASALRFDFLPAFFAIATPSSASASATTSSAAGSPFLDFLLLTFLSRLPSAGTFLDFLTGFASSASGTASLLLRSPPSTASAPSAASAKAFLFLSLPYFSAPPLHFLEIKKKMIKERVVSSPARTFSGKGKTTPHEKFVTNTQKASHRT
ncbi:hypothetical protein KUF71_022882 [Frankliniella fusca]|uniref:Uncharacterized protein n=1 Tax=Frankliniella fusca TaxID=407009 RepID=A0AAE1LC79_9NEOP|nr:hypothetical protein KUF71_022882 [Frankliniella fusca]